MTKPYSIHLRLNPDNEEQRQALDCLRSMDRRRYGSYNRVIAKAVTEFFGKHTVSAETLTEAEQKHIDEYMQILTESVNHNLERTLPSFLAGLFANSIHLPQSVPDEPSVSQNNAIEVSDIDWDFLGEV